MSRFKSTDIKIGVLNDIKKQITTKNNTLFTFFGDTRGILYEPSSEGAHDIIYPTLYYPYREDKKYEERVQVVEKGMPLSPLLEHMGMYDFSYEDLQEFMEDVLLRKAWLKENEDLFGVIKKKIGIIELYSPLTDGIAPLSYDLYRLIEQIQSSNGFNLTDIEQKRLSPKKY